MKDIDITIGYDKKGNRVLTKIDASKAGGGIIEVTPKEDVDFSKGTKITDIRDATTSIETQRKVGEIVKAYEEKYGKKMPEEARNFIEKGIDAYEKYKSIGNPRNIRNYVENIEKIEKTLNGIGKVSKAIKVIGGIAIAVDAGMTLKRAADKYNAAGVQVH